MMSPSAPASTRLAAHGQRDAGHLVDERDGLVALDQFGLHQVGGAQQLPGAQAVARRHADRLVAVADDVAADLGARPALDDDVGRLEDLAALDRP